MYVYTYVCMYMHFGDGKLYMCICMYMCIDLYLCIYLYNEMYVYIYMCVYAYLRIGWRRLIGSPKLQIIFHKRATRYRSLLQQTAYKEKGSCESSPPCSYGCTLRMISYTCVYVCICI